MTEAASPKNPAPGSPADADEAAFGELESTEQKSPGSEDPAVIGHGVEDRARTLGTEHVAPFLPVARKSLLTGILLTVLMLIPYAHPALERFRVLSPGVSFLADDPDAPMAMVPDAAQVVGEASLPGATDDQQSRGDELEAAPVVARGPIAKGEVLPMPAAVQEGKAPEPIFDPSGRALERYFDKLLLCEQKAPGATARVVYYGDSIVASDFITGKLRRLLQTRFGDAGHGYAIAANAFPGWFHIDVSRKASAQWKTSRCIGPFAADALYGLGCVSFTARKADEWFSMGTADLDTWGRSVSRFELEYLEQPGGGELELLVDGESRETFSTDGSAAAVKYKLVEVPDGPHKLEVRTKSDAPTRLFGMRMERDVPGVTLSALGITGARARFLDKQDDAHWAEVLRAAKPDLVVLAFGTNEVADGRMGFDEQGQLSKDPMGDYERSLGAVMDQVRAAVPGASTMLVGPPDMASKKEEEGHAKPLVAVFAAAQRKVAEAKGWAFFDQQKAMGGSGSMWTWVQSGMGNTDMIHPTGSGGNRLGTLQYLAVMEAYEAFKEKKRAAPAP